MPGIFGVVDIGAVRSEQTRRELVVIVSRMSAAMMYERSFTQFIVSCPALGACVGRVDRDAAAGRPSPTVARGAVALTAGEGRADEPETGAPEICIGPGAREMLLACGDAEEGLTTLSHLVSGFMADSASGRCLLFNDRFGRERIFLHKSDSRVYFSSEAKAILAVVPETRAFDLTGLAQLMACGCTLHGHSLFQGIEVLEGGTVLTFKGPVVRRKRYFGPADLEHVTAVPSGQFMEGFIESLRSAVAGSLRRTSRVGISLTGGLDSRMIMASLAAPRGSVPCYTFGSMFRTTADVAVARRVAAACGQPYQVIELGRAFLRTARENLEHSVYVSDGYLGLSGAAELYVNRAARTIAPARLTGNWGGELMRGVRAFRYSMPKGDFVGPVLTQRMRESAADFSMTGSHPLSGALFHQIPFQGYGRYAIERSQVATASPFLAPAVIEWLYRIPGVVRAARSTPTTVIGQRPELLGIATDQGLLGRGHPLFRRASRRLLVKAEYLTSHGAPDWLARFSAQLPGSLLETRFLGVDKFQHFRHWMRRDLAGLVREILLHENPSALRGHFDLARIAQMVGDHIDGRANFTDEIDKLMALVIAERQLFASNRFDAALRTAPAELAER